MRYDVAGIEKVGQNNCYVVEMRSGRGTNISTSGEPGRVLYVRKDKWLVVREMEANWSHGESRPPSLRDYPLGLFGPFIPERRIPRFPLQLMTQDTVFRRERRDDCCADLREISRPADRALVERLLAEGDTVDSRAIRPTGAVYQVRSELGGSFVPGSQTGQRDIVQSLQFWSDGLPWRLYEELVDYRGPKHVGAVQERSWLVAVGHTKK